MNGSNEELLREGECPAPDCIEAAGHAGPHSSEAMTDPCPDAEKAALAEALDMAIDTFAVDEELPRPAGRLEAWIDKYGDVTDYDILVRLRKIRADISPAAKEILEKAQAHDRQAKLIRLLLPDSLLREVIEEWPTRAQREAAADELQRRAALKEPE